MPQDHTLVIILTSATLRCLPGYDAAPPDAGMIYTNQSSLDYNGIVEVPATSIVGICGADRGLPEFIKRRVNNDVRRC